MDAETAYFRLKAIVLEEYPDIVLSASIARGPLNAEKSLRIFIIDDSFLEIWISGEKYSYHWQRKDGEIYRHDNAPHLRHKSVSTFPKHFHDGSEDNVRDSYLSKDPLIAIREILKSIRERIL